MIVVQYYKAGWRLNNDLRKSGDYVHDKNTTFQRYCIIKLYVPKAPKTKKMQTNIQAVMAFMPSVLGELEVTVLKILISTRNRVINMAMRPGTTSGGTKKLTQDTTTNRPEIILIGTYRNLICTIP